MSEAPEDADLRTEQFQLLLRKDEIDRQVRELSSQSNLLQRRLDEIAAERRGRAHVRNAAPPAPPAAEKSSSY